VLQKKVSTPALSTPAFSTLVISCRVVHSRVFHSRVFSTGRITGLARPSVYMSVRPSVCHVLVPISKTKRRRKNNIDVNVSQRMRNSRASFQLKGQRSWLGSGLGLRNSKLGGRPHNMSALHGLHLRWFAIHGTTMKTSRGRLWSAATSSESSTCNWVLAAGSIVTCHVYMSQANVGLYCSAPVSSVVARSTRAMCSLTQLPVFEPT